MTIAEQTIAIVAGLAAWASANSGRAFPASDVVDVFEQLRAKPGAPSCAVLFWSEDPRDNFELLGRVDRTFKIIVSRGRGFKLQTGESLTDGASGGPPMFDLVEEAREVARNLRGDLPGEEAVPIYKGCGPFEASGLLLDAYEIRISFPNQLPVDAADPGES